MPKEVDDFQFKVVKIVQQYPCLYNFQLPEYSRRDLVSAAWEKVAQEIKESAQECKAIWRTLRIMYTRSIRLPPSGSGVNKLTQKTKDMIKEMDFVRPYVSAENSQDLPSNLPPLPSPDSQDLNSSETTRDEEDDFEIESPRTGDENHIEQPTEPATTSTLQLKRQIQVQPPTKKKRNLQSDRDIEVDDCVMKYINNKQSVLENPKKMFLLSLLPDLEQMNDRQMRRFRTKVSEIVDSILADESLRSSACTVTPPVSSHTETAQASNFAQQPSKNWISSGVEYSQGVENPEYGQLAWYDRNSQNQVSQI